MIVLQVVALIANLVTLACVTRTMCLMNQATKCDDIERPTEKANRTCYVVGVNRHDAKEHSFQFYEKYVTLRTVDITDYKRLFGLPKTDVIAVSPLA